METIQQNIRLGKYKPQIPYPSKELYPVYPSNYIFDKDKSVTWNQAQLQKFKDRRQEAMTAYRKSMNDGEDRFKSDVADEIAHSFNFNKAAAELIFNRAWDEGHSEGFNQVLQDAFDLADFVKTIMDMVK